MLAVVAACVAFVWAAVGGPRWLSVACGALSVGVLVLGLGLIFFFIGRGLLRGFKGGSSQYASEDKPPMAKLLADLNTAVSDADQIGANIPPDVRRAINQVLTAN